MLENAYIIPLLPGLSFLAILLFGKRIKGGQGAHYIGVPVLAVVWVLSLIAVFGWINRVDDVTPAEEAGVTTTEIAGSSVGTAGDPSSPVVLAAEGEGEAGVEAGGHEAFAEPVTRSATWWSNAGENFRVGTLVDGLSVTLLFVVSTVALLVHIYSIEYVRGDERYTHYYAFLSFFSAAMLFFVLSQNIIQMIVGWELVGVSSFVLIGHWWESLDNSNAAMKAFMTNRVGDVGLLVGMIILYFAAGSFEVPVINEMAASGQIRHLLLLVAAGSLTAAVMSKSGQFPLHTWLPDAMAGPTPVSALIHAATMVVAGVYMVARLYPVFYEGYSIGTSSINGLALLGGFTAFMAAALAFVQWDIKKVLAYSTISQLGYMVMALGVGAWTAAIFHLFTHALFKACLFLGAGSVSHASHHTFDMREMGGLRKVMPHTYKTFVLASLALAGVFPLAGFWSKDEILVGAMRGQQNGYPLMLFFGLLVAFMTAAYMTRVIWYTFWGEYRGHGTPHESPALITGPLWILAGGAVLGGLVNLPSAVADKIGLGGAAHLIETYAEPVRYLDQFSTFSVAAPSLGLALTGLALALGGILAVYLYYWRQLGPHGLTEQNVWARRGYTFLVNKYYLDHLYTGIIARGVRGPVAQAAYWFNQNVIDRIVNLVGDSARETGRWVYTNIDQGVVDGTVNGLSSGAEATGEGLRVIQSGRVQQYGSLLFGAAAVLAIIFTIVI
ncbi:MAG TPA: NADH-quinone oxidoreductase subunit L [Acidimicrobiales bacterium]|nr:NADH-quinone oxidoreductase subunit L [Acidimicrobiales bacterium]